MGVLAPVLAGLFGWGASKGLDAFVNSREDGGGSGNSFSGTPEKYGKIRTKLNSQNRLFKDLRQSGGGLGENPLYARGEDYLYDLLSNSQGSMDRFQEPYLQNFNERIAPGIAERFAGAGTGSGAYNSSAFQNSISQAGRGLQSDLASMRETQRAGASGQALNYAQQPVSNLMQLLNYQPFENTHTARQPGIQDSLAGMLPEALKGLFNSFSSYNKGTPTPGGSGTNVAAPSQNGGIGSGGSYNPGLYNAINR
jgi:hypothetical protein